MVNDVEKIKERVDIVDLISSYLKLQKAGVNYKAKCPFHNEKTPSFSVSAERQIWHCFGCSKGGDIFTFVQEIEGADFPEALRILAKRAGVELDHFDRSLQSEKTRLLEICDLASRFFQKQLWHSNVGSRVLAYLKGRGVEEESIRQFQLGYAPDSWDSLSNFLKSRGFRDQEIFNAGLSVRRESAGGRSDGYYDRFRSRITFPVLDINGQAVGFTGRAFEQAVPTRQAVGTPTSNFDQSKRIDKNQSVGAKYINTPQTLIYDKSRVIYGLDKARGEIRVKDKCVVVEGNMDVIMAHQAGVKNTVASSGTAFTEQHLKAIKRYTNNLDLCFDQDAAGSSATERAIASALQQNFNLGVIQIEDAECKDPADYVKKYGQKLHELFKNAKPVVEFFINYASKIFDPETAVGKKMIAEKVLPIIKSMPNEVEKSSWVAELALRLKTKESILTEQMAKGTAGNVGLGNFQQKGNVGIGVVGSDVLEDYLVSLLMLEPKLVSTASLAKNDFLSQRLKLFFEMFKSYLAQGGKEKAIDYLEKNSSASENNLEKMHLERLYLQAKEFNLDHGMLKDEFIFVLSKLQDRTVKLKLNELEMAIRLAERDRNRELTASLLNEFKQLANYLNKTNE